MSYATVQELRARIGASIFAEIYGEEGTTEAEADLASAEAEIDGAAALRYRMPVTGVRSLALLKDWTLTLCEERTYARAAGSDYTEKIKARTAQVRKYLEMIRLDQFRLPDAQENGPGTGRGGVALVQCDAPVFGRERMKGF